MRFASLPLVGLLLAAAPALAFDPVEALTTLVREASAAPNPVMAFLQGAARLPDFSLRQADIQRAMEAAGVPPNGPIRQLLGPTTRLNKRGRNLSARRSRASLVEVPGGFVELGQEIEASLSVQGPHDARVDNVQGIRVGKKRNGLNTLKRVQFTRQRGRQVAILTGSANIFLLGEVEGTETIDLGPAGPARSSGDQPTRRTQPNGRGFTDALGN